MDFGVVGLEGFVGSEATNTGFTSLASDPETMQKWYGSGFLKQERSGNNEDDRRSSKLAKFDAFSASKATFLNQRNTSLRSNTSIFSDGQQQQQILSFSAPKSEVYSVDRGSQNVAFPYFNLTSPAYTRNTVGWGAFHLGFSNNTDPEPGRCRRTDGKKWRCSRDAVADQKYCERHMNRGRHRSRKPVEGQSGHSAAATTTKLMPTVSSSPASGVGPTSGSGASNSLSIAQKQLKNLQPGSASNLYAEAPLNRLPGLPSAHCYSYLVLLSKE
ncbi:Growth-regulating factor 7 [Hibiscus syriacus]|uniref:Growth-regulating factor n=1 Tax=Hibiscus syriacus TaxID=106335 RepID=A0A6A2WV09_HIBSY|nr:Growth-regulating factor 7 [Hibiscus syriacus]